MKEKMSYLLNKFMLKKTKTNENTHLIIQKTEEKKK